MTFKTYLLSYLVKAYTCFH